jgi:hypothetical protein
MIVNAKGGRKLVHLLHDLSQPWANAIESWWSWIRWVQSFSSIIIHLGTNDIPECSVEDAVLRLSNCIHLLKSISPDCKLYACKIGPRNSQGNHRYPPDAPALTMKIELYNNLIHQIPNLIVFATTYNLHKSPDGLHLGFEQSMSLRNQIVSFLRYHD